MRTSVLEFWLTIGAAELFLTSVFGIIGGIVFGRRIVRSVIAVSILCLGAAYQLSLSILLGSQPQPCASADQELFLALLFLPLLAVQKAWIVVVAAGAMAAFVLRTLPRKGRMARIALSVGGLIVLGTIVAVLARVTTLGDLRCIDF